MTSINFYIRSVITNNYIMTEFRLLFVVFVTKCIENKECIIPLVCIQYSSSSFIIIKFSKPHESCDFRTTQICAADLHRVSLLFGIELVGSKVARFMNQIFQSCHS